MTCIVLRQQKPANDGRWDVATAAEASDFSFSQSDKVNPGAFVVAAEVPTTQDDECDFSNADTVIALGTKSAAPSSWTGSASAILQASWSESSIAGF